MSLYKSRVATGVGFIVFAALIAAGWAAYAAWSAPRATGLEIKDGAAFSVIPLGLSLIALVWGSALIFTARRHRAGKAKAGLPYGAVDATIVAWAKRRGLTLSTEFGGGARRFCYVTVGKHECFQVSIEPPESGSVTVNACGVETQDDAEFHEQWQVALQDLDLALEAALRQIADWGQRASASQ